MFKAASRTVGRSRMVTIMQLDYVHIFTVSFDLVVEKSKFFFSFFLFSPSPSSICRTKTQCAVMNNFLCQVSHQLLCSFCLNHLVWTVIKLFVNELLSSLKFVCTFQPWYLLTFSSYSVGKAETDGNTIDIVNQTQPPYRVTKNSLNYNNDLRDKYSWVLQWFASIAHHGFKIQPSQYVVGVRLSRLLFFQHLG